jgi:hypothetical protein
MKVHSQVKDNADAVIRTGPALGDFYDGLRGRARGIAIIRPASL